MHIYSTRCIREQIFSPAQHRLMHHPVSASEEKDKIPLTYRRKDPVYEWSILQLMDERITPPSILHRLLLLSPVSTVSLRQVFNNCISARFIKCIVEFVLKLRGKSNTHLTIKTFPPTRTKYNAMEEMQYTGKPARIFLS